MIEPIYLCLTTVGKYYIGGTSDGGYFNGFLSYPIVGTPNEQNSNTGSDIYSCIASCPQLNSCQNGGRCTSAQSSSVLCQCPASYEGSRCTDKIASYTLSPASSLGIYLPEELFSLQLQILPITTNGVLIDYPGAIRLR